MIVIKITKILLSKIKQFIVGVVWVTIIISIFVTCIIISLIGSIRFKQ
jgi:hypothetical protein